MKNLIEFLSTHSVNYALINGYLTVVLLIAIIIIISLYLRLKEAKTWIKFSEIEKKQNRSELKEEKSFCETQGSMYSKLLIRHSELKQGFEDAVAEITKLRSEKKVTDSNIDLLDEINKTLTDRVTYWKERALHQKHTKKVVESEWYELINDQDYMKELFNTNKKYKIYHIKPSKDTLLFLIGNDNKPYLVYKSDFKPVTK